jgi:hypothetical protein
MAGSSPRFSAAKFRTKLRAAMEMGTPSGTDERVAFHHPTATATVANHDGLGIPFDPTAFRTEVTPASTSVTCATECFDAGGEAFTPFGVTKAARVVVTLFEDEYALVKDCTHITVRGDTYRFSHEPPAFGLFDVTVHQLVYRTDNET